MTTEHLDYEIMQLTKWNEDNLLHEKGKEKLTEFKAIKQALNIDDVNKCSHPYVSVTDEDGDTYCSKCEKYLITC